MKKKRPTPNERAKRILKIYDEQGKEVAQSEFFLELVRILSGK